MALSARRILLCLSFVVVLCLAQAAVTSGKATDAEPVLSVYVRVDFHVLLAVHRWRQNAESNQLALGGGYPKMRTHAEVKRLAGRVGGRGFAGHAQSLCVPLSL